MGSWQLEVARMFLYMAFPVACFHYFNQPENFEEFVINVRKEMLHAETQESRDELKKFFEEHARAENLKKLEAMEASEKKFKELKSKNT
ncbi:protein PET100 homolog, mitochondrial [Belonocnema kinseyi]|uniref:protein PET100 homolog, mitochondrial n=1 Tax=Belonocnema kinseyi TaxID=2817044 RepID=UPI00143D77FC|nr:protein PET100 homolog, mitochondrial [Belonocnema kinseyi]